jgi:hypothetical protein
MSIGFSLSAVAFGAILKFAVTAQVAGISISTVGVILMVVGVTGLIVSLWMILAGRRLLRADHQGRRAFSAPAPAIAAGPAC